jgi:hypothetical protein
MHIFKFKSDKHMYIYNVIIYEIKLMLSYAKAKSD